ncbi:MAG TPA: DUF885 family protein, partial [Steroidobacteraceae bacterium]|nr:DUF885 family protein [Steroidobacteraceae bacterium]
MRSTHSGFIGALACAAVMLAADAAAAEPGAGAPSPAVRELHALFESAWDRDMREDPLRASYYGDRRFEREWTDYSQAAIERRHAGNVATLERLRRIDRAALPPDERLSYDLFEREYATRIAAHPFKPWLYEIRASEGVHTLSALAELLPFATGADYENWIARLGSIDEHLAQHAA